MKYVYSAGFELLGLADNEEFHEYIKLTVEKMIEKDLKKHLTSYRGIGAEITMYVGECEINVVFLKG